MFLVQWKKFILHSERIVRKSNQKHIYAHNFYTLFDTKKNDVSRWQCHEYTPHEES